MDEKRLAAMEERLSDSVVVHRSVELWRSVREIRVRPSDVRDLIAAVRERGKPVAWMYVENCETYFGHPDGYRPADAKPLYLAPPTVAAAQCVGEGSPMSYVRAIDLARQLERELATARAECERMRQELDHARDWLKESRENGHRLLEAADGWKLSAAEWQKRAESAEADRACLEKLVVRVSKYPMHRAEELSAGTIRKMALETLAQINAERGKA